MKLLLQIIAEYFQSKIEGFWNRNKTPSFLALSVVQFTYENWLDGVVRQGRFQEYFYHPSPLDNTESV